MRPWLGDRSLDQLNSCARRIALQTESAKPVVFVPPGAKDAYYEIKVYEGQAHGFYGAAERDADGRVVAFLDRHLRG